MKNKGIKLFILSLASLLVVGCNQQSNSSSGGGGGGGTIIPKPDVTTVNLVENNKSDYTIVYPLNCPTVVLSAASELQLFIEMSSGVTIPMVQDGGDVFNENHKVISLGETQIFKTSGLKITDDMRNTGYLLKRMGNTLVVNARDGNGVSNAIYDMLKYTIDLEIYAEDEYAYKNMDTIPLLDFDIKHIPYIDVRTILGKSLTTRYRRRLKLYTAQGTGHWVTFAHTVITTYLPISEYGLAHPDWYNAAKTQVCYSNAEMRAEMVKRIKQEITKNPDGIYVMIGHEDNFDMCTCDNCVAERELYGGYGGQEMYFTNLVASEVDPWVEENYPERDLYYVFFAYQTSNMPPIKYSLVDGVETPEVDENGDYIPVYDFKLRDDVAVYYCPIEADFSKPFDEINNGNQYLQLKGWSDIFHRYGYYNNIMIWNYSLSVRNYMLPFNDFGMSKQHYDFFKELGAIYLQDQANHDSGIPCFEALRFYTKSKLMYEPNLDYNEMVDDFSKHYYDVASEEMLEYFYLVRALYNEKEVSGSIWESIETTELWSLETVERIMKIFDRALADVETLKDSDPERYIIINDRIRRERLTPIFLLMRLYFTFLTQEQKEEFLSDLLYYTDKFDINETGESQNNMNGILEDWKHQILG